MKNGVFHGFPNAKYSDKEAAKKIKKKELY